MNRDAITGVPSRSTFRQRLVQELQRAAAEGQALSLLLVDLDYFKSVNDAFGHSRGDQVLQEWTERLGEALRPSDSLFRYGGDEFVVVLPGTTLSQASAVGLRILADTRSRPFGDHPPLTLSVSIGVASFPEEAPNEDDLFQLADRRLLDAKRQGRGRVVDGQSHRPRAGSGTYASSRLISRDDALQVLQRYLVQLPFTRRGLLTVRGVPGVGRTRFLQEVDESARLLGFAVAAGAAEKVRRVEPYSSLRSIAESLVPGGAAPRTDQEWLRLLTGRASLGSGLLIVLDDADSLDRSSRELLRRLVQVREPGILGVVFAVEAARPLPLSVGRQVTQETIDLAPLGRDGLRVWMREQLQLEPPEQLLDWFARETGGLPGQLDEAIEKLERSGYLSRTDEKWELGTELRSGVSTSDLRLAPALQRGNLPALLTSFVGRERELENLGDLLGESRLVTLAGPGGIGKTRLAIEAGRESLDQFPDGVWLVELAALSSDGSAASNGSRIIEAVAAALGLVGEPDRSIEAMVAAHLQSRQLLLLLDNCEHVVGPAARVAEQLLQQSPRLSILATSREPLNIGGEYVLRVPALSFPTSTRLTATNLDAASVGLRFEAVRLFCTRASHARPDFTLTPENVRAVVRICRELDGIPLAIELAAARVSVLPVEQVAARLGERFRLLRGGSRTALPRQQTLKALIDWSYNLLTEGEQRLLQALSVFAAGWCAEAAEMVGTDPAEPDVFDTLSRLVDKSLVQADSPESAGAEPRYRLLETIREYARDRLAESGEANRRRDLHVTYYLHLAELAEPELKGPQQRAWLERMEAEHDNLRLALERARVTYPISGLRLAAALSRYWHVHGHLAEGQETLADLLTAARGELIADSDGELSGPHLKALLAVAQLSHILGDVNASVSYLRTALRIADRVVDARSRALALAQLGYPLHQSGKEAESAIVWEEGLALARKLGDPWVTAFALRSWAFHKHLLGADDEVQASLEESLELLRPTGDEWMIAHALWRLGVSYLWRRGDHRTAAIMLRESCTLWTALRDRIGVGHVLSELGWATYMDGNVSEAWSVFEELLALARDRDDLPRLAIGLHHVGKLALLEGDYDRSVAWCEEFLKLDRRSWPVHQNEPWVLQNLALIEVLRGRHERGREQLRSLIPAFKEQGSELGVIVCVQGLARLHVQARPTVAAALFGWASRGFDRTGWASAHWMHPEDPEDIASLRAALGEREYAAARRTGESLSTEQAIATALEEGTTLPANLTCR